MNARVRRGLVLLLGGVLFGLVVGSDPANFSWTPLGVGLAYLAASIAGGRREGFWATAAVLVPWGATVAWFAEARPADIGTEGAYLAAVGVGALLALALAHRGFDVAPVAVAATIVAAGLLLAVEPRFPDVIADGRTYALALGAVGLFNVVTGATRRS